MWQFLGENSKEIMALVSILGLLSLLLGLWSLSLIREQIKSARIWNKLHFTYTFFPNPMEFVKTQDFLKSILESWRNFEPFTDLEVKALLTPEKLSEEEKGLIEEKITSDEANNSIKALNAASQKLTAYLNQIERYCAAIKTGIVDLDTAGAHYNYQFTTVFHIVRPWIEKLRRTRKAPNLYIEFEEVIGLWNPKNIQKKKY